MKSGNSGFDLQHHFQSFSDELWQRVKARQALIRDKVGSEKAGGLARKPASRAYLLSGLIYCGECGKPMTLTHDRYKCRSALRRTGCGNHRVVHRASLEKHLMEALASNIRSEAQLAEIKGLFMSDLAAELKQQKAWEEQALSQKRALTEEKNQLEAALRNLTEEVASYGGNDALRAAMRMKNARLKTVTETLGRAEQHAKVFSEEEITAFLRDALDNLAEVLLGDPIRSKQELLKRVCSLKLTPVEQDGELAFAITGDLTLFTEEEMLLLPNTGTGTEEQQQSAFKLDGLVLKVDTRGNIVAVTGAKSGKEKSYLEGRLLNR